MLALEATGAEARRLQAVLQEVRVGSLHEHLVRLVHRVDHSSVVVRLLHRQQREIGELGSAVAQID